MNNYSKLNLAKNQKALKELNSLVPSAPFILKVKSQIHLCACILGLNFLPDLAKGAEARQANGCSPLSLFPHWPVAKMQEKNNVFGTSETVFWSGIDPKIDLKHI